MHYLLIRYKLWRLSGHHMLQHRLVMINSIPIGDVFLLPKAHQHIRVLRMTLHLEVAVVIVQSCIQSKVPEVSRLFLGLFVG